MQLKRACSLLLIVFTSAVAVAAQENYPLPGPTPGKKISTVLAEKFGAFDKLPDSTGENRSLAYAKLLEGQRHIWAITNARRKGSAPAAAANAALARESLVAAVTLNPKLAEAYTALAEIYVSSTPADVDEALSLAAMAVKISPDNFGSLRMIARLKTYKSGITRGNPDSAASAGAIAAWREIVRLDPRNAEAWAFLSEFYERAGKTDEQIAALKSWLASAPPLDEQFFQRTIGGRASLAPQTASLRLGPALLKAGRIEEAIDVLSTVAADNPENEEAIDLLRGAVESLSGPLAERASRSLGSVVAANPSNLGLVELLAQVNGRKGDPDGAAKLLRATADKVLSTDKTSASGLYLSLGDIYAKADRTDEAVAAYDKALTVRGLGAAKDISDDDREFAMQVFERLLQALKAANRPVQVRAAIDRARRMFGADDLFADRSLIAYLREAGKKDEALAAIRKVRTRLPDDYGFLRLEATLLTELGRVDEAVAIVKTSMKKTSPAGAPIGSVGTVLSAVPSGDEFSNYLFISNLYAQANRGREAAESADQAYAVAKGAERKQIARLTRASAQQMSGDYKGAESTLRAILSESPGNPIAMNNLGYFLLERNERLEEARDLIEQAYRIDPTNPSYLDSLGWANFLLGKLPEAERYMKDAARLNPGSATIQEHLGDVYAKQGKLDLARPAWEKALQLASEPSDIARIKAKLKNR